MMLQENLVLQIGLPLKTFLPENGVISKDRARLQGMHFLIGTLQKLVFFCVAPANLHLPLALSVHSANAFDHKISPQRRVQGRSIGILFPVGKKISTQVKWFEMSEKFA